MIRKLLFSIVFYAALTAAQAQTPGDAPRESKNLICQTSVGLAKAWHQKGNDFFLTGDLAEAIVFFKKSLDADSNFCDPAYALSISYGTLGTLDSAEMFARKAYSLNQSEKIKFNLATTLGLREKYDEAIPLLQSLLATDYRKPIVHQSLAQMYLFRERFDEAIEQAYASLALCESTDPRTAGADYLILGSAWLWQQKPEKARPMLLKAIELGANVPESYQKAAGIK